jgi:rhodanese-related sulfurtransferase
MNTKHLIAALSVVAVCTWGVAQAGTCGAKAAKSSCSSDVKAACGAKQASVEAGVINTAALDALLSAKTPLVLLDARSGKYDDGRRIPGAKSLNSKSSADAVASVIPAKDALVVTYCANVKCPASAKLAKHLIELGYTNILEYPEGIDGWVAAGKEVTKVSTDS